MNQVSLLDKGIKLKPFIGDIHYHDVEYQGLVKEVWQLRDEYAYGFSAIDHEGRRVDPAKIRRKIDGTFLIIEK